MNIEQLLLLLCLIDLLVELGILVLELEVQLNLARVGDFRLAGVGEIWQLANPERLLFLEIAKNVLVGLNELLELLQLFGVLLILFRECLLVLVEAHLAHLPFLLDLLNDLPRGRFDDLLKGNLVRLSQIAQHVVGDLVAQPVQLIVRVFLIHQIAVVHLPLPVACRLVRVLHLLA